MQEVVCFLTVGGFFLQKMYHFDLVKFLLCREILFYLALFNLVVLSKFSPLSFIWDDDNSFVSLLDQIIEGLWQTSLVHISRVNKAQLLGFFYFLLAGQSGYLIDHLQLIIEQILGYFSLINLVVQVVLEYYSNNCITFLK